MENILDLILVNRSTNQRQTILLNQSASFLFKICNMSLPNCQSDFVYILISCNDPGLNYIGASKCIKNRLNQHNPGFGSTSTSPLHLRMFALLAYICGLNGNKHLRFCIESE